MGADSCNRGWWRRLCLFLCLLRLPSVADARRRLTMQEACGEYMFRGLYRPEYRGGEGGGGFHLLDQFGEAGPTPADKHGAAKAEVWAHIQAVLARGGSVAEK